MLLVDTSVWIDLFAGRHTKNTDLLFAAIDDSQDLCTCGFVTTEVLQGIRSDKEYERVKAILSGLIYLPVTKEIFLKASVIYRRIRKAGKTIRSPMDCMIAAICLEHEISLLHNDRDYDTIGHFFPLKD